MTKVLFANAINVDDVLCEICIDICVMAVSICVVIRNIVGCIVNSCLYRRLFSMCATLHVVGLGLSRGKDLMTFRAFKDVLNTLAVWLMLLQLGRAVIYAETSWARV